MSYDLTPNAAYIITDAIKDGEGNLVEVINPRNIKSTFEYDSRDRQIRQFNAKNTTVETKTETDYDLDGNVIEVRSPRYFDSADTNGYNKSKTTYTYNGRGMRASTTEAPGTAVAATTSVTFTLDGRVDKRTDALGHDWHTFYHNCCGRTQGSKDPAGHGGITNNDYTGRVTHTAMVADYDSHTDKHNPIDAKTLGESTTRFDMLGRTIARTQWLVAQGTIDANDAPIAGLDGVSAADGITSQTIYDNNMNDGFGLDSSGGVTVNKLGGGTFSVSLSNAMTKLADSVANGGAGLSFTSGESACNAVVSINGEEEISFRISDGAGRTVMSGQIQSHADPSPNDLITHSCQKHDTVINIAGFGDTLESRSIDANGKMTKTRADGAGRVLESEDQLGNVSVMTYSASGQVLTSRDPNGVGVDRVFDDLDRVISTTDTWGDQNLVAYYVGGMVKTQTDATSKSNTNVYDERGRLVTVTDRLSNDTKFTYNLAGRRLSIKDAENKITLYEYNNRGQQTKTTYPDHTGGNPGDASYGIVEVEYDEAGRVLRKTDQIGDTVTINYDLAGRMTQRDYRTAANSPSGTIADSDTFTFDKAGRVLTAVSGRYVNTVTMTYDLGGRLASEALTISPQTYTTSYEYNNLGQRSKITYPDTTEVERTYTDRGQLYQVKYKGLVVDTRTYDGGGRLSTSSDFAGNGALTTWNYRSSGANKDNLVDSIVTTTSGTDKVGDYAYAWDANKNKTAETITNSPMSTHGFTTGSTGYDDTDRLVNWERSDGNLDQSWSLSDVGDWNSHTVNTVATTRTHSDVHEVTAVGSNVMSYDVKGNLTSDGIKNQDYEWDFDNRLSKLDRSSGADIFAKYDALGRRVEWGTTGNMKTYVYAGQQVIGKYDTGTAASSPTLKWVFGSYIDEPILMDRISGSTWHQFYYHRNHQYSIVALSNASGDVLERYVYDAYGTPTIYNAAGTTVRTSSSYQNPFMFTGRFYHSSVELHYFRARMYDSDLGRFVSRDPLEYVDGASLYTGYFANRGADPLGLKKISAFFNLRQKLKRYEYEPNHEHGKKIFPEPIIERKNTVRWYIQLALEGTTSNNKNFQTGFRVTPKTSDGVDMKLASDVGFQFWKRKNAVPVDSIKGKTIMRTGNQDATFCVECREIGFNYQFSKKRNKKSNEVIGEIAFDVFSKIIPGGKAIDILVGGDTKSTVIDITKHVIDIKKGDFEDHIKKKLFIDLIENYKIDGHIILCADNAASLKLNNWPAALRRKDDLINFRALPVEKPWKYGRKGDLVANWDKFEVFQSNLVSDIGPIQDLDLPDSPRRIHSLRGEVPK